MHELSLTAGLAKRHTLLAFVFACRHLVCVRQGKHTNVTCRKPEIICIVNRINVDKGFLCKYFFFFFSSFFFVALFSSVRDARARVCVCVCERE